MSHAKIGIALLSLSGLAVTGCVGEPQSISEAFFWVARAPNIEQNLHGLCDSTDSFQVVGEENGVAYMLEWRQNEWSRPILPPLPPLRNCYGWDGKTIVVGDSGSLYTRRVETWNVEELPLPYDDVNFVDVWGSDEFQIIVGNRDENGGPVVLIYEEDETWRELDVSSLGNGPVNTVWALDREHVWLAGDGGLLAQLVDRTFVVTPSPSDLDWQGLAGSFSNEVYAFGSQNDTRGQLIRFDGEAWSLSQERDFGVVAGWTNSNRHLYWAGGNSFLRNMRNFVQFAGNDTDLTTSPDIEIIDVVGFARSVVALARNTENGFSVVLSHGPAVGGGLVRP